jgi:hypothetical protein
MQTSYQIPTYINEKSMALTFGMKRNEEEGKGSTDRAEYNQMDAGEKRSLGYTFHSRKPPFRGRQKCEIT